MIKLFRQWWWKVLALFLLVGSIAAGLYTPLSPGLQSIDPTIAYQGETVTVTIEGYNTNFLNDDEQALVMLFNGDRKICARTIKYVNAHTIQATIDIPASVPIDGEYEKFNVLVNNSHDGSFISAASFSIDKKEGLVANQAFESCQPGVELTSHSGFSFPHKKILYESIRNLFYHVPMWFAMVLMLLLSVSFSIAYLASGKYLHDMIAQNAAVVALMFGTLGILTGMQWANMTWGQPWPNDPKLNGAAVGMLIYIAYFILRGSLKDELQRAKVAGVYSIFAFVIYIVFIFVIPRLTDTLHPGAGGNPGFNAYDLDNNMRPVFYGAVIGFAGIGLWIIGLRVRLQRMKRILELGEDHDV